MPRPGKGVIEEFQRRRKRMVQYLGFSLILFAFGLLLMQFADMVPTLLGMGKRGWKTLAVVQLFAGVIFALLGFNQYRCPVCNEIVKGHDKYYLGTLMNPTKCPQCGARLNDDDA